MCRDRNGSDWIRTEANFGRIRTASDCNFFENWRMRTGSDWEHLLFWWDYSNHIKHVSEGIFCHQWQKLYCRGDESICYCGSLCQLPLTKRATQLFSHTTKPVKNEKKLFINRNKQQTKVIKSSKLLVSPECFAGCMKFFCGPHAPGGLHVRHLCWDDFAMHPTLSPLDI